MWGVGGVSFLVCVVVGVDLIKIGYMCKKIDVLPCNTMWCSGRQTKFLQITSEENFLVQ